MSESCHLEDNISRIYFILSAFAIVIGRRPPRSLNGVLPAQRWGSGGVYLAISGYVGASMLQAIFIPLMFDLASELRYAASVSLTVHTRAKQHSNRHSLLQHK
jgi:hypothetical protein